MKKNCCSKVYNWIVKISKESFQEIELFKRSNWRNLVKNPIINNFVVISTIIILIYLAWTMYHKSYEYFSTNELLNDISGKYNTTKENVIASQEESFIITTVYDSIKNTSSNNISRDNSELLKYNDNVPLKYIVDKEDKESFDLGDIGDFIGGYFGFWIGIIGALLTFLAFYVQYRANRDVQKQFRLQQFENQLYKMIDVYLNNKDKFSNPGYKNPQNKAIDLKNVEGESILVKLENLYKKDTSTVNNKSTEKSTKNYSLVAFNNNYTNHDNEGKFFEYHTRDHLVFQKLLVELKAINRIFLEAYKSKHNFKEIDLDSNVKKEIFMNSYKVFFDGLNKFEKHYPSSGKEYVLFAVKKLKIIRDIHKKNGTKVFHSFYEVQKEVGQGVEYKTLWLKLNYEPFKGYLHFLPQYFRGLYSIVNFVVNENEDLNLSKDQKKIYLRTLRSTMSDYEQTLLFYNWYGNFGFRWEDKKNKFFTNFKMIHNLRRITLIDDSLDLKAILDLNDDEFAEVFDNFEAEYINT